MGNVAAISAGLVVTVVLGGLHVDVANLVAGPNTYRVPAWLPKVAFTWFAMIGAVVVFVVGVMFRTPEGVVQGAREADKMGLAVARDQSIRNA